MKLKELIKDLPHRKLLDVDNREITGISFDSRKVREGHLFVAMRGVHLDGHRFLDDALARGAAAVIVERKDVILPSDVPKIVVENGRKALSAVSAAFFGDPSRRMTVVGVTGTNGKTTTTYLLRAVLNACGYSCGLLGTIAYQVGERDIQSTNTTPESHDIQGFFAEMAAGGFTHAVMEVSSHGIDQGRIEGIHFNAGIFTNAVSHEHLDYHRTFRSYLRTKISFFEEYLARSQKERKAGFINADDPNARFFAAALAKQKISCVLYGKHRSAHVRLLDYRIATDGNHLTILLGGAKEEFYTKIQGIGNVYNTLAVIAYGWREGLPIEKVRAGLAGIAAVPGRFEAVVEGQPFSVIVDYAHTHQALAGLLVSARALKPKRLIVVFGCGGDRDRTKRPLMGRVAAGMADIVIITSDNPRTEDPHRIIGDIQKGIPFWLRRKYVAIEDRGRAIREAVALARPGDCVMIAGKGHETYQILKQTWIPFDDREEARCALRVLKTT